ncbi:MAG: hypothetical protein NQ127_03330 [Candidatus Cardinium sp.]|nr:hypothetical protein [Candidatus Cardinium sp.]
MAQVIKQYGRWLIYSPPIKKRYTACRRYRFIHCIATGWMAFSLESCSHIVMRIRDDQGLQEERRTIEVKTQMKQLKREVELELELVKHIKKVIPDLINLTPPVGFYLSPKYINITGWKIAGRTLILLLTVGLGLQTVNYYTLPLPKLPSTAVKEINNSVDYNLDELSKTYSLREAGIIAYV